MRIPILLLTFAGCLAAQMDSPITVSDSGTPLGHGTKAQNAVYNTVAAWHPTKFNDILGVLHFRDDGYRAYCIEGAASQPIKLGGFQTWKLSLDIGGGKTVELRSGGPKNWDVDLDMKGHRHTAPIGPPWVSYLPNLVFTMVTFASTPPTSFKPYASNTVVVHYCQNNSCKPDPCP